jgi:hypothetical protein
MKKIQNKKLREINQKAGHDPEEAKSRRRAKRGMSVLCVGESEEEPAALLRLQALKKG